jgi:hypothetical protein
MPDVDPEKDVKDPKDAKDPSIRDAKDAKLGGVIPRAMEKLFDFFLEKPGRRTADYGRANLNVKLVLALVGTLTLGWRFINSQQAAYERLVDRMVEQFAAQHRETIGALDKMEKSQVGALEKLEGAQIKMADEQKENTRTMREAFLAKGHK